ncbi:TonB-dependent receptor [Rhodohalobacter sp. SW132]|uniref:TonB-dependent receptor plug domain-containing protein n=1 Tax=Rhodohalobacter sp. SW132 TaxID=2293433 RepID=UPI000E256A9A|nr:TonB-dependent receptor [Rhodohalobacter sp. SW132]REL33468.1 TonB-dependent receptor [Rhodohalobacter sp. SW132]
MSKIYLLLAGFLLCASAIQAQPFIESEPSDVATDTLELDRVVVTASKLPLTQRETTKPVILITREEIERNSGRDLSQILNQQSGIRVNDSYGAPSNGRILYLQGAAAQNTLILVDGLPVSDPSGVGGLFDLRLLPTNNIEQIEIIKGSQSTLYGTDAIAGVVNLITRSGGDELVNATGRLSYGSYNTFNGNVGVNGSAGERVRYTLNYNRETSDGFSAARDPEDTGTFGDDGYSLDSFFGKADVSVTENLTISPFLNYSKNEGDYDADAFQDADNFYSLELLNPGVQAQFSRGDLRLNGGYNYSRTQRMFDSQFGVNEFEGQMHNADLFGNYRLTNHLQVLAGFNFQDFTIPESEDEGFDNNGNPVTVVFEERDAQVVSPYATLYLKDWNGLSTEIGYRLNNHSEYGNNSTFSIAPSYQVTDQVKLFASVSSGFKAPTLDELFGQFGANPDLDPQTSLYFNIGAESYLLDQSLKLSAQYFNREIDDLIIYGPTGYINRDRQNDQGIELSADWIINNRIRTGAWYNYLDGEITTFGEDGEDTQSNLIRRPTNSFGFNAGVSVTDQIYVRLDGEYNGERTDIFFNPDNFMQEDVTLDAYTLVNIYAEYKLYDGRFTIFGDVKNLFNSDFTEVYGYNTMGTAVKAGLRFNL